jgi:predicted nucleotidyltransferase
MKSHKTDKLSLGSQAKEQIQQCLRLLLDILHEDLLAVYLYGSAIVEGLQRHSDIDLFVIVKRPTTSEEKSIIIKNLLQISGIYQKTSKKPIEMTIVVKSEVNPWKYPPLFDFQYGDWLREEFGKGIIEPWPSKEMPDLALLITQILLASKKLFGTDETLLCPVPYGDFISATTDALDELRANLNSDTRNVLLTYARIWCTVETDRIDSKSKAGEWAIHRLPNEYKPVLVRARAIYLDEEEEHWEDLKGLIQPCVDWILSRIHEQISIKSLQPCNNLKVRLGESRKKIQK